MYITHNVIIYIIITIIYFGNHASLALNQPDGPLLLLSQQPQQLPSTKPQSSPLPPPSPPPIPSLQQPTTQQLPQLQQQHHHHNQPHQTKTPTTGQYHEQTVKVVKGKIKDGKFTGDSYVSSYTFDPSQQMLHRYDQHLRVDGDQDEVTYVSKGSSSPLNSQYLIFDDNSRHLIPQSCQAPSSPLIGQHHHQQVELDKNNNDINNINNNDNGAQQSLTSLASRPSNQNSNLDTYPLSHQYVNNIHPYYNHHHNQNHHHQQQHHHHNMINNYENSLMGAIRQYWKEILGLCITSGIFFNWLFGIIRRKVYNLVRPEHQENADELSNHRAASILAATNTLNQPATKSMSKDTASSLAHDSAYDDNVSPLTAYDLEHSTSSPTASSSRSSSSASDFDSDKNPDVFLNNGGDNNNLINDSSSIDSVNSFPKQNNNRQAAARQKFKHHHHQYPQYQQHNHIRQRSSTLKAAGAAALAEPIPIPRSPRRSTNSGGSRGSSLSNSFTKSEFNSRYVSDFVSIRRLGRGGFGIVFEAKNTIDDCSYAIKRICLPLEQEARERVMREVRALAKLDHPGIVRYYNAWLEHPPEDWLKEHDAKLGITDGKHDKNIYSTDGIYGDRKNMMNYDDDFGHNMSIDSDSNNKHSDEDSGDDDFDDLFKKRMTVGGGGRRRYMNNDSGSQSLDIVFEGSGSLRQERAAIHHDILSEKKNNNKLHKDIDNSNKAAATAAALRLMSENSALQQEKAYLYIQMQLCHKETLKDWLVTNCETRDKIQIFDLFYQIVDAVEYVHSQDLIHRDLKDRTTVKIGDFGLCRARTSTNAAAIGSSLDLQEHAAESEVMRGFESMHTEQVGTQLYMSPEQLNGLSYNQKVDIFAMGLILLELLNPFKTQMQRAHILFKARNNLYSEEFRTNHPKEHELVKSLLNRCPQRRPTATEIKQHDLLANAQLCPPVMERINGSHRRRTISSNSSTD